MKKAIVLFAVWACSLTLPAQVNDNFNDGDLTTNPAWIGGITDFTVTAGELKSANTASNSIFYLSTGSTLALNCQWEFWSKLQFNPSGSNYVDVYLVSDQANLLSPAINGYFVRIGSSTDDICLYKVAAGVATKIIDGADGILNTSSSTFKIKVIRDSANNWDLQRDLGGTGSNYMSEGTVIDAAFNTTVAFGLVVKQSTASFFQKHFFDDVYAGPILLDVTPPAISALQLVSAAQLDVSFDEKVSAGTSQNAANYAISPSLAIISASQDANDQKLIHLSTAGFSSGTHYTLTVSGVQDLSNNTLSNGSAVFSYYRPRPYDVVFNELMPDPDPAIGLPDVEYVELKNRAHFPISLRHWSVSTLTSFKLLPDISLPADSFVVLTGTGNAALFAAQGIAAYDVTSFPSLINSGTTLCLRDSNGTLIHTIAYTDAWYNDASKADGGWSLEQVDANNPCAGADNWTASHNSSGGTPGMRNSAAGANPDQANPVPERISVISPDSLLLLFSEPLDSLSLLNAAMYSFDNGLGQPLSVLPTGYAFTKAKLRLPAPLQPGIVYHCTVGGQVCDCLGNPVAAGNSIAFALPEPVAPNELIINEVLFNPKTGGDDFVELYNKSQKTIDLKSLRIGSMDTVAGTLIDTKPIAPDGYLFFPGTYIVISESGSTVKQQYFSSNPGGFVDVPDLPAMNDDADVVTLSDAGGQVIDNFVYTDKMHFPLLTDHKGVSLERIDFNRPAGDLTNWNSAAQTVGFATPAYRNSQYMAAGGGNGVSIANSLFSPDNDGYQDVLDISYSFDGPGRSANIFIYDSKGRQVRYLTKNDQLPQTGVISWNGIGDNGEKAPLGIYIVYAEVFDTGGRVDKYKLSCVLAGRL